MKDYDPDSFAKLMIKAVALTVSIMILVFGGCNIHADYRIAQAIKEGSDPVLARAAFSYSDGSYERVIHVAKERR